MARLNALNITLAGTTDKEKLAEIYGAVINNVQLMSVSAALKNTQYSGNIAAGTVEVKRFVNSQSDVYGAARAAQAGAAVKAKPVVVSVDTPREIVEEIEAFDMAQYGVPAMLAKRAADHAASMARELDRAFFVEACAAGSAVTTSKTKVTEKLEALILDIEKTKNTFVDGIDRADIAIVVSLETASALRNELDVLPQGTSVTNGIVGTFHDVAVYKSNRLPAGVEAIGMRYDSIAQPVISSEYTDEKIPLSDAHAVELFYKFGTKAVTEDLIKYLGTYTPAVASESDEG